MDADKTHWEKSLMVTAKNAASYINKIQEEITPWNNSYAATDLPSIKLSKKYEQNMQNPAGEARMN